MQAQRTAPAAMQERQSHLRATTLKFRAGQLIFEQGQTASRWFEVVRGTVRTCRFHIDGNRHLTGFFFSGDVFGADHGAYGTAAEAVTDVVVRCFRIGDITQEATPRPQLDEAVAILIRAMSTAQRYQFIMGRRSAAERLAAFLLCLKQQAGADPRVQLPMGRTDIADLLSLTMHTVSRAFSELSRRGLIEVEGRRAIVVTDNIGLCDLAGEYPSGLANDPDTQLHPAATRCFGNLSAA